MNDNANVPYPIPSVFLHYSFVTGTIYLLNFTTLFHAPVDNFWCTRDRGGETRKWSYQNDLSQLIYRVQLPQNSISPLRFEIFEENLKIHRIFEHEAVPVTIKPPVAAVSSFGMHMSTRSIVNRLVCFHRLSTGPIANNVQVLDIIRVMSVSTGSPLRAAI